MTNIHDESYWSTEFDISQNDLNRMAERLEHEEVPQDLKKIALRLLEGGMEHAQEFIDQQAEDILLKYSEAILSRLAEALQSDSRFVGLEGKWFIADQLPQIERDALQKVHRILLRNPSTLVDEILSVVKEDLPMDTTLGSMALHDALRQSPKHFENLGTATHPQWKARLPDPEQAEATHYAYDPETFEVLCRPGQRLSQKKAQRLQALNLYAHIVTFAD